MNLSIVIRTNGIECIPSVLGSIDGQRTKHTILEVIIVECSCAIQAYVDDLQECYSHLPIRLVWYDDDRFSYGRSLNIGISHTRGDIVVLLTGHSVPFATDWLDRLVAPLMAPDIAGICGAQLPNASSNLLEKAYRRLWYSYSIFGRMLRVFNATHAAIRKEAWIKIPFSETIDICEDRLWAQQIRKLGLRTVFVSDCAVYHSHNDSYIGLIQYFWRLWRAMTRIYVQRPH